MSAVCRWRGERRRKSDGGVVRSGRSLQGVLILCSHSPLAFGFVVKSIDSNIVDVIIFISLKGEEGVALVFSAHCEVSKEGEGGISGMLLTSLDGQEDDVTHCTMQ